MKTTHLLPITCAFALFAVSCAENPADDVPKADVSEATEETTTEPEPAPAPEEPVEVAPPSAENSNEPEAPLDEATPEPTPAPEAAGDVVAYTFTEESKIEFVGSKVTGSHEGGFETFEGNFSIKGDQPGPGPHTLTIDMNSVWSDNEKLTGHLKSADFFEVETYPSSTFTVNSVEPAEGEDSYTLKGTLELHGQTKAISFPATVTEDGDKILLDSEFAINRKDFGINYPGKADDLIRDEVVIKLAMVAAPAM